MERGNFIRKTAAKWFRNICTFGWRKREPARKQGSSRQYFGGWGKPEKANKNPSGPERWQCKREKKRQEMIKLSMDFEEDTGETMNIRLYDINYWKCAKCKHQTQETQVTTSHIAKT